MKIAILGTSGSGKSTLARVLGRRLDLPVLHLDAVHFLPGWVERPLAEEIALVEHFLDTHDGWVIDGNYSKTCYARRLAEADRILVLEFSRWVCLTRVVRRWRENRGRTRGSMAAGCPEKLDAEFIWWVLYQGRTGAHRQRWAQLLRDDPEKAVHLRSPRQLRRYLARELGATAN